MVLRPGVAKAEAVTAGQVLVEVLRREAGIALAVKPWGLSGILCVRPVSSLVDEPLAEDDGELGLGLEPFARRSFPLLGRVVQDQI